eukprot:3039813-Amphidinium_carterae.1
MALSNMAKCSECSAVGCKSESTFFWWAQDDVRILKQFPFQGRHVVDGECRSQLNLTELA